MESYKGRRNRSRKNKNVSISSDSVYDSVAKTRLSESEAKAEERSNRKARNRTMSSVYSSLLLAIPTMQFSLDRKQRGRISVLLPSPSV